MSARYMFYPEGKEFSTAEERAFAREELVYNVTEDILVLLENLNVSKKELARRLGKSRSYVTQSLNGARNLTLGSLSDICFALNVTPSFHYSIQSDIEAFTNDHPSLWTNECFNKSNEELISKAENVIDCRERPEWMPDAA